MRDLRRKLLSLGNHFFERLKTANFSTACGTSTLKSLPSRAFFVSDVHLRPRKHFSRCTLDCGFKTAESPALRGFEAGPRALATAALYLVLKSNGYNHPEIRLKKFDFSPKTTSANIVKKLSAHSLLKSVLFRIFSFSHKCLTFAFFGAAATAGLCKLAAVLSTLCSLPALRGTLLALVKAHAALTSPHIVQAIRISCLCVWIPSPAKGRKALFGGGQSAA